MPTSHIALYLLAIIIAAVAGLYALHRLGLWLEERGLIYYWHRKGTGSALGSFVAMQQVLEPTSQHVFEVADEKSATTPRRTPRVRSCRRAPGANAARLGFPAPMTMETIVSL